MIQLKRTNSNNSDFIELVKELDAYLKIVDGDDHSFYNQYNSIETIKHVVVAYLDFTPIGCGAIKKLDNTSMEIKRMFVSPKTRGHGVATSILIELETWAKELNYKKCILETGKRQVEAIQLYKKNDYKIIPNYGQYKNVENSFCFEKHI
ncbi:GNAT family N-acetyltransferase [Urechidicola croceus]|uniref:GNAT family N-acetyltransferase n=1 Tax=Urechidicola croceus TaxID=1850246 RepID=A0A1D8P8Q6_9FLAO|nr:GNAT family N-acetyltransferase [Urechidicola croceus]AOW20963.1 GNAT family N-acetyltransferase [Urechidicola croceus]